MGLVEVECPVVVASSLSSLLLFVSFFFSLLYWFARRRASLGGSVTFEELPSVAVRVHFPLIGVLGPVVGPFRTTARFHVVQSVLALGDVAVLSFDAPGNAQELIDHMPSFHV